MKNLILLYVASTVTFVIGMNISIPFSDGQNYVQVSEKDNHESAFNKLVQYNALLLKNRLEREKRGEHCKDLPHAEEIIRNAFISHDNILIPMLKKEFSDNKDIKDQQFIMFLFSIAQKKGKTAKLIAAITEGDLGTCKTIVKNNPYVTNSFYEYTSPKASPEYITPLHYVLLQIKHGSLPEQNGTAIVTFLLENGAHPNAIDSNIFTSLFYASTPELIQLLIAHGAKTQQLPHKETPLLWHIKQHPDRKFATSYFIIKHLLCDETAINQKDEYGNTALHHAASKNYPVIVKLLLENGADYFIRNNKKLTACHVAREKSLELLRKYIHSLICTELYQNSICIISPYKPAQQILALTYIIEGTPIIEWAKKTCISDQKLNYSVIDFNQTLSKQWIYSKDIIAEKLLEAFSILMVNPYGNKEFYPLLKAIEKKKITKIKTLIERGAIMSTLLLQKIKDLNKNDLYAFAEKKYHEQICFNCKALMNANMKTVYIHNNYELFVACSECKPSEATTLF